MIACSRHTRLPRLRPLALLFALPLVAPNAGAQVIGGQLGHLLDPWLQRTPLGPAWTIEDTADPGGGVFNAVLSGVAALSNNDAWAVGSDSAFPAPGPETLVEHWDGVQWSAVPSPSQPDADNILSGVAFTSPVDGWAVGNTKSTALGTTTTLVEHWNGEEWRIIASPDLGSGSGAVSSLTCISAVNADDIWAGGYGISPFGGIVMLFEHWDGAQWSIVPPPPSLGTALFVNGIDARAADDVWAVGYDESTPFMQTLAAHWNGSAWSITLTANVNGAPTPDCKLNSVRAVSATEAWAVGFANNIDGLNKQKTIVEHWDGALWTLVKSPNPDTGGSILRGVTSRSPTDVWAVGYTHNFNAGTLSSLTMRWNGTSWTVVPSPSGIIATVLSGTTILPTGTAWAVGSTEVQGECCLRTLALLNPHG